MSKQLLEEFKNYIATFFTESEPEDFENEAGIRKVDVPSEKFYYYNEPPTHDFNRELAPPGVDKLFPEGAFAIRCDDNFWVVAVLPWKFVDLTCQEICEVLWDFKNMEFLPDEFISSKDCITLEELELDPDLREWEYAGDGRRVFKGTNNDYLKSC